jgi:hypothetical protein
VDLAIRSGSSTSTFADHSGSRRSAPGLELRSHAAVEDHGAVALEDGAKGRGHGAQGTLDMTVYDPDPKG